MFNKYCHQYARPFWISLHFFSSFFLFFFFFWYRIECVNRPSFRIVRAETRMNLELLSNFFSKYQICKPANTASSSFFFFFFFLFPSYMPLNNSFSCYSVGFLPGRVSISWRLRGVLWTHVHSILSVVIFHNSVQRVFNSLYSRYNSFFLSFFRGKKRVDMLPSEVLFVIMFLYMMWDTYRDMKWDVRTRFNYFVF